MKWYETIMKGRQFETCMTTFYMTEVENNLLWRKEIAYFFLAMNRLCHYMILISLLPVGPAYRKLSRPERTHCFRSSHPQFLQRNKWTSLLSSPQMQVKAMNQKASPMSKWGKRGELKSGLVEAGDAVCSCLVRVVLGPARVPAPITNGQSITWKPWCPFMRSENKLAALEQPPQALGWGWDAHRRSPHNYTENKRTENCQAATLSYKVPWLLFDHVYWRSAKYLSLSLKKKNKSTFKS